MDLEHPKISFEVQKLTFQDCFEAKMTFKNILEYSKSIPAKFPYIKYLFLRKINEK